MLILGIESSCDETAAAVLKNGNIILSSIVSSQIDVHHKYGGVVPELASRMHIESIVPVVSKALKDAGVKISDIDGVAATRGPGLIGALLIGFSFAKSFAWARKLPFAGVNHLEAHIYSLFLCDHKPDFPFIALVVSGGHTNIYFVSSANMFELLGQTRDDAAGEAFDKVAKMLDLGYPGGPVIEKMAEKSNPLKIQFPRTFLDKASFDFSFSGLKSAVMRYIQLNEVKHEQDKCDIAAGFQASVFDVLSKKLIDAAKFKNCKQIAITGGVAANRTFSDRLSNDTKKHGIDLFVPPAELCGDNAAMVAARGFTMIKNNNLCEHTHDVFSRNKMN